MERSVFFIYDAISQIIKEPPNLVKSFVVFQLLSYVWLFATPRTAALQASLSFTISQTLLNSCALSWWCHPTISSSVAPFSSCPQSFPASGSFPMSWLFASDSHNIGASASVLPMNKYLGLISFRINWFDFFAVQGTLKSLCYMRNWYEVTISR